MIFRDPTSKAIVIEDTQTTQQVNRSARQVALRLTSDLTALKVRVDNLERVLQERQVNLKATP